MSFARPDWKRPSVDTLPAVACETLEEVSAAMVNIISDELAEDDYYFKWCKKHDTDPTDYSSFQDYTFCESYMEVPAIDSMLLEVVNDMMKKLVSSYDLLTEAFKKAASARSTDVSSDEDY